MYTSTIINCSICCDYVSTIDGVNFELNNYICTKCDKKMADQLSQLANAVKTSTADLEIDS